MTPSKSPLSSCPECIHYDKKSNSEEIWVAYLGFMVISDRKLLETGLKQTKMIGETGMCGKRLQAWMIPESPRPLGLCISLHLLALLSLQLALSWPHAPSSPSLVTVTCTSRCPSISFMACGKEMPFLGQPQQKSQD